MQNVKSLAPQFSLSFLDNLNPCRPRFKHKTLIISKFSKIYHHNNKKPEIKEQ